MLMVRQLAYRLALKMLPATHQDSGEFIFSARLPELEEHASFYDVNISQGSLATHLRGGGIFNDCFIANFLENFIVKEF